MRVWANAHLLPKGRFTMDRKEYPTKSLYAMYKQIKNRDENEVENWMNTKLYDGEKYRLLGYIELMENATKSFTILVT